eukprot:COSAG01_NODE_172_length_23108_cov_26.690496_16_plen_70_part_00
MVHRTVCPEICIGADRAIALYLVIVRLASGNGHKLGASSYTRCYTSILGGRVSPYLVDSRPCLVVIPFK